MLSIEWTPRGSTLQLLEFDAVETETGEDATEVTEHAVEDGAAITDHARPGASTVTLAAMVSDTPVVVPGTAMDGTTGGTSSVSLGAGGGAATVLAFDAPVDRVRAVDRILQGLQTTAQLLTVRSSLRVYESVVIERYSVVRNAEMGNALDVTLALKRVRIARTQRVAVTETATRAGQRAQNRGAQPASPLTGGGRSLAASLADGAASRSVRARGLLQSAGLVR